MWQTPEGYTESEPAVALALGGWHHINDKCEALVADADDRQVVGWGGGEGYKETFCTFCSVLFVNPKLLSNKSLL